MRTKKVIITGPESTGKTVLCEYLAEKFNGIWIPEFARSYIEKHDRPYSREDVYEIARTQIRQLSDNYDGHEWVFFDTGLIITKVWLEIVYNDSPEWIKEVLVTSRPDLVLLCYPDLDWEPDKTRENGGEMRSYLFDLYETNLKKFAYPYQIVKGALENRFQNAVIAITNNV